MDREGGLLVARFVSRFDGAQDGPFGAQEWRSKAGPGGGTRPESSRSILPLRFGSSNVIIENDDHYLLLPCGWFRRRWLATELICRTVIGLKEFATPVAMTRME